MAAFGASVFLSAFLFFHLQPLMGRHLLPTFGGGPAVWSVCLVFWQGTLLAGYAWAHALRQLSSARRQAAAHSLLCLLALAFLPPTPDAAAATDGAPAWSVFSLLLRAVGLPGLVLAATGPLLQAWHAGVFPDRPPWRLYALSNAASLTALALSSTVSDLFLSRADQDRWWSAGFLAAILLTTRAGAIARDRTPSPVAPTGPPPAPSTVGLWWLLPACGAALLVSTTERLSADFAVVPLLWTLPLIIYLTTWMLTFDHPRWYRRDLLGRLLPAALGLVWLAAFLARLPGGPGFAVLLPLHLAGLLVPCLVCHGELYRLRPEPARLTAFYLAIAGGGFLGSVGAALLAPKLFPLPVELPLSLGACALLVICVRAREAPPSRRDPESLGRLTYQLGGLLVYALAWTAISLGTRGGTIRSERNFFGVASVREQTLGDAANRARVLVHGTTIHGLQFQTPGRAREATTYFGPDGGFAQIWPLMDLSRPLRVGVVGLGAGTLATYGRSGDRFCFYEINPAIAMLAREEFTFLRDSAAEIEVVIGDARSAMTGESPRSFDLLVIDAFNGGAIPLHLLTVEALRLYHRHLAPGGVIAVHGTNEHLDLEPPLQAGADAIGMAARKFSGRPDWERARDTGQRGSDWWLLRADHSAAPAKGEEPFTDERVSLLRLLK